MPTNPYVGSTTGSVVTPYWLYNNTFAGPGAGHYGGNQQACVYASVDFVNNAVGGCYSFFEPGSGSLDYNAYANGSGTTCFPTDNAPSRVCDFAYWQSHASGKDAHSVFASSAAVGSNAIGVGSNLTSLCTGDLTPLCSDINGNPRPTSGPWNAGATG